MIKKFNLHMEEDLKDGQFALAAQRQARLLGHLRTEMFADAQALKDALAYPSQRCGAI